MTGPTSGRREKSSAHRLVVLDVESEKGCGAMHIEERVVDGVTILDLEGKLIPDDGDRPLREKVGSLVHVARATA